MPADGVDPAALADSLAAVVREYHADGAVDRQECIEVRERCVGLHHRDELDVEAVFETFCAAAADRIDGVVRVGAEDRFGSLNAMLFDVDADGGVTVDALAGRTNVESFEETFTFRSVEAITPEL